MPGTYKEAFGHYLLTSEVKDGDTLTYYAGAGWDKSTDFVNSTEWEKYIQAKAAIAESPLVIDID